ncbi:isochorismatase family protein [Burkholderia ubonensis]|nr:isochorismatase family protein [Burkholderia ubonensis]
MTASIAEKEHWVICSNFDHDLLQTRLLADAARAGAHREVVVAPLGAAFDALRAERDGRGAGDRVHRFVLVRVEDLVDVAPLRAEAPRPAADAGELEYYRLPNGMEIAHLKAYESRYLYNEIFVEQTYLKNGIELHDGDIVFDIGANIGMFSLFVSRHCNGACIYAFEPSPVTFRALRANLERYAPGATAIEAGVAEADRDATFTFYPQSSVFSGFHADDADRAALRAIVSNELAADERLRGRDVSGYVEALLEHRFEQQTYDCKLRSLSSVIRELGIERIDLLKIDAEKCEEAIFDGIDAHDWAKVRQIVVEVHGHAAPARERICATLEANGFDIALVEEQMLRESGFCNIYGTRAGVRGRDTLATWETRAQSGLDALSKLLDPSTRAAHDEAPVIVIAPSSDAFVRRVPEGFVEAVEARIERMLGARPVGARVDMDGCCDADDSSDRAAHDGAWLDALVQYLEAVAAARPEAAAATADAPLAGQASRPGIPVIESYAMPVASQLPVNIARWRIDPRRAVLLLHDMQHFFVHRIPSAGAGAALVDNASAILRYCRAAGMPIAYTAQPGGMTKEQRGLLNDFWGPGMQVAPEDRNIVDGLTPEPDDWVLTKWRYSAFFKSNLLQRMRDAGRDQLIVCGVYAHIGVLTTVIESYSNDIETFLVADAIADFSLDRHLMALRYAASCCAVVLTTREVIA